MIVSASACRIAGSEGCSQQLGSSRCSALRGIVHHLRAVAALRDAGLERRLEAVEASYDDRRHGADCARCRGSRLLQPQLLAAATAINPKRLLAAR
jgi:hypothetical protein